MGIFGIVIAVILFGCLAGGVYLIVTSRRQTGSVHAPRCGRCGYNLTGSPSNRCPECGCLFIEAGVVVSSRARSGGRRVVGFVLVIASLFMLGLGSFSAVLYLRASRAQARAVQQRAIATQQLLDYQQQLLSDAKAARGEPSTTSAPADDAESIQNSTP